MLVCSSVARDTGTWSGPVGPIKRGLGADGSNGIVADSMPSRLLRSRMVHYYRPEGVERASPVVFLFPAFKSWQPVYYDHLIRHLVSRGNCVVYASYGLTQFPYQFRTYRNLFDGATEGMRALGAYADTSRIGFVGHSFGASAVPAFAYECVAGKGWGARGAFMYLMAPFYLFCCRQQKLEDFPATVNLIVQVFEDDDMNDHRMAKDVFEAIDIPAPDKDYIVLRSDTCPQSGYVFRADHDVPFGSADIEGEVDGLDFYGVFRYLDALAEWTFAADTAAREIALGDGAPLQRTMGLWRDGSPVREALVSDNAPLLRPSDFFHFKWTHPWNLRRRNDRVRLSDPWDR